KEARSGPVSEAFIDQGLAGYGTDIRTLVAKGVGCWLGENHFPGEVVDRIETLFPLEGKG
ncbi:MAG: hypothetical protein VX916_04145, partial [Planctomycetota bacterium]|nr:hypothetical protein [Planctomycetota bacterium]